MHDLIHRLIAATNAFDVKAALELFARDAVIDDVSVGQTFAGLAGVRRYLEQFFVGYHTVSKVLSIDPHGDNRALVRLDFTGDFGHETGRLDVTTNTDGLIAAIDADLD
ncbi:MAG: snoaL-like domain protein [Devosia sp.]|uniref:nuclear transport factor 2 family protein n=1 Tax=Devosia sp. TaxID=1871048 RepID=UPI002624F0C1|nr:nuclear transport factor 2 family protein [Devosia sp.]MDB5535771.1 snoaL-like domain protein [Devosia sp.]MDB5588347.1 snoaL-like domain protein [Devosia sp.]